MTRTYLSLRIRFMLAAAVCCCSCKDQPPVVYPQKRELVDAVYASGKIVAENEYSLFALSNGRIIKKLVRDGDTVHKGQVLYVISNDAAQARLEAAQQGYKCECY